MSLYDFGRENYDATAWVNDALAARPEDEAFEGYLAGLTMRLHMTSQDYTDQLETAMLDATQTIPRVQNDINRIEDVLKSVDSEMQELANQLKLFDQRNVAGVEELSRLDMLRRNMENSLSTLEEHARWSQVVREAKTFLEGGGRLADSADRISTMVHSMKLLEQTPGHEDRKQTCQLMSDSLLTAVNPGVSAAIAADIVDVPSLLEYFYVYQKLDRLNELHNEYIAARSKQKSLVEVWSLFDTANEDLSTFYLSFARSLSSFVVKENASLSILFKEQSYDLNEANSAKFKGTRGSIAELLSEIVQGIHESTARKYLSKHLEESASPTDIITVYKTTNALVLFVVAQLLGRTSQSADEGMNIAILALLKAAFDPLATDVDAMYAADARVLRATLTDTFESISSKVSVPSFAEDDESGKSFEDATGLGLTIDDVNGSSGGLDTSVGGGGVADPLRQCLVLSERLLNASGAFAKPVSASVYRAGLVFSGLHLKTRIRATANDLGQHINKIAGKMEDIRRTCGLANTSLAAAAESKANRDDGLSSHTHAKVGVPSTVELADSWIRQLDESEALICGAIRELLPVTMRLLQCTGRILRGVKSIDAYSVKSCEQLAQKFPIIARSEDLANQVIGVARKTMDEIMTHSDTETPDGIPFDAFMALSAPTDSKEGDIIGDSGGFDIGAFYAADACLHNSALGDTRHAIRARDYRDFLFSASPSLHSALRHMKVLSGCLFLDSCVALPMRLLHHYSTESSWSIASSSALSKNNASGSGESGEKDMAWELVIDENMLPQSSLTQCGEHLLSLVQDLESFSTSDALIDLRALLGMSDIILPHSLSWGSQLTQALVKVSSKIANQGLDNSIISEGVMQLCKRSTCVACVSVCEKVVFGSVLTDLADYEGEQDILAKDTIESASSGADSAEVVLPDSSSVLYSQTDDSTDDSAAVDFVNEWLGALGDALIGSMVSKIVQIKELSSSGRAQLAIDLDYLTNVISAVGLRTHPLLLHIRTLISAQKDSEALLQALMAMPAVKPVSVSLRLVDMALAKAMAAGASL